MSFFDIFSVKSIDNTVNAVIDTGDALFYTEEERARAEQLKVETKLAMLPLYEPFKIAQRYLAFAFTANFLIAFWVAIVMYLYAPTYLDGFLKLIATFELGWIMLAIVSFYFGGGLIGSIKGKKIV